MRIKKIKILPFDFLVLNKIEGTPILKLSKNVYGKSKFVKKLSKKGIPSLKYLPCRNEGILQFLRQTAEFFSKCWIQDFLKPHKISALLDDFFFHSFLGGPKKKKLKNQCIVLAIFQHFSFGPPLETMKKKLSKRAEIL